MTLRVLMVIDHLGLGGGQVSTRTIVPELARRPEVEPLVCALRTANETIELDVPVINLNMGKYSLGAPRRVLDVCREHWVGVCHSQLSKSNLACLLARRRGGPPVIVHERGMALRRGLSAWVYRHSLRRLHRHAHRLIANSQAMRRSLVDAVGIDERMIRTMPNPVDTAGLQPSAEGRRALRDELNVSDDACVIGYLGRLHPVKGVDILLEAAPLLAERLGEYRLVVAGDGPERQRLEQRALELGVAERVRFLGMRQDVAATASGFDLVVMPSRQEAFGRVAVEMMQLGVPLIANPADGLAELVEDGRTALVLPANTPEAIAEAVVRLWQSPDLRRRLTERGRDFARQYSVERHVDELLTVYRSAIGHSSEALRSTE